MRRFPFPLLVFISFSSFCQLHRQPDATAIKLQLKKLNFLGTVLYVAAHPDDENTRAITFFANDKLATTAYLSITRGDGGQNLIGPEIRDQLGLIRTQELLSARQIDGGHQFFTRAIDFGYSKRATETFDIWNKQEILSDVVRIMREFKPDVILTRFPPDERAGHGQHTASGVLAEEAFDLASNPDFLPDQVKDFGTWQARRLYTNTGRWWNQTINENTPGIVVVDVGTYNDLLGKSYSEIAAESRTQHKSQGFGSAGRRGEALEFFEYVKGEKAQKDFFENINTTWTRVVGGELIQLLVDKAIKEFDEEKPFNSIPQLLQIRKEITLLDKSIWKERKLADLNILIQDCLGLFVEVTADNYWVAPGQQVKCSFELVNRSPVDVKLESIKSYGLSMDSSADVHLLNNKLHVFNSKKSLSPTLVYSDPYWLSSDHGPGTFKVTNKNLIGKPENDPAVTVTLSFLVNGERLEIRSPLLYKWTDPVRGELWRPFEIVPPVFVNLTERVLLFKDQNPKDVFVLLKSAADKRMTGQLTLSMPAGWRSEPMAQPFDLVKRGEEKTLSFKVYPSKEEMSSSLTAVAVIDGKSYDLSVQTIMYDHIPTQTLLPKASSKIIKVDLKKEGAMIGYIKGAGDDIPGALRNIGYEVWEMKNEEVTSENLKKVDAVVLGIRTLNTNDRVRYFMPDLLSYVKTGGTLVVQYNTNHDLEIDKDKFSPFPLTLSRDRVTEESSEVRILKPDHPVLNYPNKITTKDFEGWVQERGLYFPDTWDPAFDAILSANDTGEKARDGVLLVAKYGEGHYVYTGLSFFRELPEGVMGAYKLFANLASISKVKKPQSQKIKHTR
ncbi:MAG: PIG-L family deacetylase [Bacteroidota bacterium]